MGSNRAGANLRRKRKRHLKNLDTFVAAQEKREAAKPPRKPAKAAAKSH